MERPSSRDVHFFGAAAEAMRRILVEMPAARDARNTAASFAAQRHGSTPVLRELLAHGANVYASNDEGTSLLNAAARGEMWTLYAS